jgi:hypothetical protein
MGRLRSLGYGVAVAGLVFTYLALPMLRELYGPEVMLVVYGVLAVIAGGLAYEASQLLGGWGDTDGERPQDAPPRRIETERESDEETHDPDIDRELETIRERDND